MIYCSGQQTFIWKYLYMLVTHSCPALCDITESSLTGFSDHGILQTRILEWIVIPFSRGSFWPRYLTQVSCIAGRFLITEPRGNPNFLHWSSELKDDRLSTEYCVLVTQACPTVCDPMDCTAHQALLSMGFPRQRYWSGLPFPSPGDLPDPGIKPRSLALQIDSSPSEPPRKPAIKC